MKRYGISAKVQKICNEVEHQERPARARRSSDKSDLVLCYSIVYGHSCMKPAYFLFYVIVLVLVLLEDILKLFKPQCSLDVQKYSFAYQVIDIWNSLSSDIVNTSSIYVFKKAKLESVDFTPFLRVEFT